MKQIWRQYCFLLLLLLASGCALFAPKEKFIARAITYNELAGWPVDDHAQALHTFLSSCPLLSAKARAQATGSGLHIPEPVWQSLCDDAAATALSGDLQAARDFFERRFVPWRISNNGREQGLFTGYYEPVLYGARRKYGDFLYPLYIAPPELARSKPYFSRTEIDGGALDGRGLEIIWVDDPVMLFFLHIQGSGRIKLMNGKELPIGYADQNGHGYVALGKVMRDEGLLAPDQVNFFTIRQWLYQNPQRAFDLMQRNPSYVFFKLRDKPGAIGAAGAALTPQRSLAVDSRYIPYGLPLFLETELPAQPLQQPLAFHRLVIAQDTGGAIKGPVRGDIFFGPGDEAEYLAGYMKGKGIYSLLVPKEIAYQLEQK
jgi:membrane-bound lytic murein transglycosylase A